MDRGCELGMHDSQCGNVESGMKMERVVGDSVEMTFMSDDEESDSRGDPHPQQQVSPGSVIVEGSQDVHVGPRLTYNGPFTVNQIVQVTGGNRDYNEDIQRRLLKQLITAPGSCADPPSSTTEVNLPKCEAETDQGEVPPHRQAASKNAIVKRLLCAATVVILFTAICLVIAFLTQSSHFETSVSTQTSTSGNIGLDPIQLPGGHHIYSKQQWRGLDARSESPLLHPTPVVVVSHTRTQDCHNFDGCSETVRRIQTSHVSTKGARTGAEIVDIGYNFLIGGDGSVYEGRGWDAMSFHKRPEGVLGISFIGNFNKHELTDGQIGAAQELLALGVRLRKLSPFYLLIAHSQTMDTDSPGRNVVKVIKKWPHWSPTYQMA